MERKGKLYLALHVVKNCCIQDTRQKSDVVKMVNFCRVVLLLHCCFYYSFTLQNTKSYSVCSRDSSSRTDLVNPQTFVLAVELLNPSSLNISVSIFIIFIIT